MRGRHAPALPHDAIPLACPTEYDAIKAAVQVIRQGRIIWKIERPDGTVIARKEIEFIYLVHAGE